MKKLKRYVICIAIVLTHGYNKIKKISERRCFIWQQNQRISMLALSRK